jgi:hypothetical protein
MIYYLLFLDAGIKRYEFLKIWMKSDLKNKFESVLNPELIRVDFLLAGTASVGFRIRAVGFKLIWMGQICSYRFALSDLFGASDGDPTAVIEAERNTPIRLGFR